MYPATEIREDPIQLEGSNPGAGNEVQLVLPGSYQYELVAVFTTLQTGVAAPVRRPVLLITDGNVTVARIATSAEFPASTSCDLQWAVGIGTEIFSNTFGDLTSPLPPLILDAGYIIQTTTHGLAAADNYGAMRAFVKRRAPVQEPRPSPLVLTDPAPLMALGI